MLAADPASIARGRAAFDRLECARCHTHEGASVEASRDCAGCHRAIHEGTYTREGVTTEMATDFRAHVHHLVEVPRLDHLDGWLSREWVTRFLLAPHDVRPALEETMPALPMSEDVAVDLAAFLVPSAAREPERSIADDDAAIERGRAHAERLGCPSCHGFGTLWATPADGPALAPDLAHARVRLQRDAIVGFLLDPSAARPGTAMPRLVLDETTAREIAAFLVHAPLEEPAPMAPFARLPPLTRDVTFEEIEERVLRRSCWHCHADESLAYGDGGPGNTGGFGFAPREVDLSSYTHVMSGALDREGQHVSLFREIDGEPALLRVLLARHDEVRGVIDPDVRGMPLGLPPLDAEQIQLIESWIAQGRPR
ncbi:MAG: cytochrome C oxidase Cbb3 [Deltaproteobacteria bacterium]|nr:cytochrome C oxidase Cbb3 [Deltaproteobacteria bacterium]